MSVRAGVNRFSIDANLVLRAAGKTAITASGSFLAMTAAASPMHGAVLRPSGSAMMCFTRGSCWRTSGACSWFVTTTIRESPTNGRTRSTVC